MASTMYYGGDKAARVCEGGVNCLHNSANLIYKCLDDLLDSYPCKDDTQPFVIADYGCGDCSIGLPLFNAMIEKVQGKLGSNKEIVLILEDQIGNDFNALFSILFGEQVTVFVNASSMYKKCLPPNYADFALTSSFIHFLSKLPCYVKGGVTHLDADETEYEQLKTCAENDWKDFVISRGKELKPGGKLVIITLTKDRDGNVIDEVVGGLLTLTTIANQLLSEKYITQEEFVSMTYTGFFGMSEDDFRKIFSQSDSEIQELELDLEYFEYNKTVYIPGLSGEENNNEAKKRQHARRVAGLHKLWLYSSIYQGLSSDRSETDKRRIADLYFEKLEGICL